VLKDPKEHPKHYTLSGENAPEAAISLLLCCRALPGLLDKGGALTNEGRRDNANVTTKFGKNVAIYSEQKIRSFIT
jgi:hypothetical protein